MKKTVASFALIMLTLAGCSGEAPAETQETPVEAHETPEPVVTATPDETSALWDDTVPVGDTAEVLDGDAHYKVTVGEADYAIWETMQADPEWEYTPPEDGNTFVMVPVTVEHLGEGTSDVWMDLALDFMTENQAILGPAQTQLWDGSALFEQPGIGQGGVVEGTVVFEVPEGTDFGLVMAYVLSGTADPVLFETDGA